MGVCHFRRRASRSPRSEVRRVSGRIFHEILPAPPRRPPPRHGAFGLYKNVVRWGDTEPDGGLMWTPLVVAARARGFRHLRGNRRCGEDDGQPTRGGIPSGEGACGLPHERTDEDVARRRGATSLRGRWRWRGGGGFFA